MGLDVNRTSPPEPTEHAVAWLLMYVLPVPGELLGTSKASVAIGTDSPRPAVHVTIAAVLGGLDSYMPSGFVSPSLGYVSLYSDRRRPGNAYLVVQLLRKVGSRF